ncbi:MAG: DUF983 domain-containing protein [Longimicrobiales bacterium]|nr:DUF983 domain-containing protein [Longimicrobiales bacterium]
MDEYPRPPARRMLARALRRRCPLCGGSNLFTGWVEPKEACPRCQLKLDRGEGDFFLGGYTLNFIAVELALAGFLVLALALTWPEVPWNALLWIGAPMVVLAPIALYPVTRLLWLAVDLVMRPPGPLDFPEPGLDHDRPRVS